MPESARLLACFEPRPRILGAYAGHQFDLVQARRDRLAETLSFDGGREALMELTMKVADVMISYTSDGTQLAHSLGGRLSAGGRAVWQYRDRIEVGGEIPLACLNAAANCQVFVAACTPLWPQSRACQDELSSAIMSAWQTSTPRIALWDLGAVIPTGLRGRRIVDRNPDSLIEWLEQDGSSGEPPVSIARPGAVDRALALLERTPGWRARYHDGDHGSVAGTADGALRSVDRRLEHVDFLERNRPVRPDLEHQESEFVQLCFLYGAVIRWLSLARISRGQRTSSGELE